MSNVGLHEQINEVFLKCNNQCVTTGSTCEIWPVVDSLLPSSQISVGSDDAVVVLKDDTHVCIGMSFKPSHSNDIIRHGCLKYNSGILDWQGSSISANADDDLMTILPSLNNSSDDYLQQQPHTALMTTALLPIATPRRSDGIMPSSFELDCPATPKRKNYVRSSIPMCPCAPRKVRRILHFNDCDVIDVTSVVRKLDSLWVIET
jgi:hypothetical protein